ncbi:S-crystallin SL11-like isoform X1 [Octopus bimaculoides]|uniref:S-crystallin SL11-like isoform X1 n=1 Tax=Octopus bimaculoides TaxID=37653 RepID=UPI0022E08B03|nr:S-crystallin SL11-like isoform X1 [Octopus bimaculoides]
MVVVVQKFVEFCLQPLVSIIPTEGLKSQNGTVSKTERWDRCITAQGDYLEEDDVKNLEMNFSILPVLQIDGETEIPQSMAIARYLAREFGFHGKNNVDMARIESICDCLNDILDDYLQLYYEKNFSKKAALRDHYNDTCRRILPFLEKTLGQYDNGAKYFFGEQIMLCDMMCYAALESPINDNQTILKDYPKLRNLRHRVVCHPQISAYILKRSDTTF